MHVEISKPIDELSELEALVLMNRWVKLKGYFFYDDRDALYDRKDGTLKRFLAEGIVRVSKVVQRETQAIAGMKVEIANNGVNLDWLDYLSSDYYDALNSLPSGNHYKVLSDLANGCYSVTVGTDEYAQMYQKWQIKHQEYLEIERQYKEVTAARNAENYRYQQELDAYQTKHYLAFYEYLNSLDMLNGEDKQVLMLLKKNKRSSKQQKQIGFAITRHRFSYSDSPPIKPVFPKLKQPQQPVKPSSTTYLAPDDYVRGVHEEIDAAIAWVKKFLNRPDLQASDINDDFVCCELEPALADEALKALRQQAIAIFKQVVSWELTDPRIIWDRLTDLPLDYEAAIGMSSHSNYRFHETTHKDFSKWHEIEFSQTGYWLVEFESVENPSITFHCPYDRQVQFFGKSILDLAKVDSSEQISYGREASIQEQKQYPIEQLVKILGKDADDFPCGLQKYSKSRYGYRAYRCWDDDEDWIMEFDEDD